MPYRTLMLAALVLVGCSPGNDPAEARKARQLQRQEASEAVLSKTPDARTYRYDGNELKVIEVPVRDAAGFVDIQRCFVWRDAEFRSAALSCGQQPDILLAN